MAAKKNSDLVIPQHPEVARRVQDTWQGIHRDQANTSLLDGLRREKTMPNMDLPKVPKPKGCVPSSYLNNSVAPFATMGKPTCGFFFSRGTDHRKRNFGIPATNVAAWRTTHTPPN
ncbi:hypothetical protein CAPTEDRAFT_225125 [Capitella teleta]|uniref:Uncharacterized protein n=1 Tax=Capitella teleta TaxID=283909 RepID=R7U0R2_CAPTE|nr:hypothetical protein CAPTEDRAFT_225125 [Capitella teleta]|eukprot:ELT96780.1 hypothetical protein CAPTEDRAFT_225125 [Capitella teleta]